MIEEPTPIAAATLFLSGLALPNLAIGGQAGPSKVTLLRNVRNVHPQGGPLSARTDVLARGNRIERVPLPAAPSRPM